MTITATNVHIKRYLDDDGDDAGDDAVAAA